MVELNETLGLWERSLIAWPDGQQDTTTFVAWLQGPSLFADLRQPANPPSFDDVTCLNDLQCHHLEWLARQEGFAGRFARAGDAFEWHRMIDYQCASDTADAGYLSFSDGILVERGRDIPYIEHWHQTSQRIPPYFAARMRDQNGLEGFLVRVGDIFMYVRNRAVTLPRGGSLAQLVSDGSPQETRSLLDCEISLGRVREGSWLIGRSSLPFRVNADLAPKFSGDDANIAIADITAAGEASVRNWKIVDLEVDPQKQNSPGKEHDEGALFFFQSMTGRA
ncbi:hypothetical protein [Hyphomicrobium sp. 99]|uniref:hypothetical protein n=1 Tax=Hyphomicrobium sp. 99 TaxID=1163419 RepID=UPI0009E3F092|nr:hypothetical protein [Hyphomicrobium sp. 99]